MSWSEEELQERVRARARALKRSLKTVLATADLSPETFQKVPAQGRRIDTLEKLAGALDWSLAEILGLSMFKVTGDLVLKAYKATIRGLRHKDVSEEQWSEIFANHYNVLARIKADGGDIGESVVNAMGDLVATQQSASSSKE